MNIAEIREKSKQTLAAAPRDVLVVGVLIAACTATFGLGYLAGRDAEQGSEASEASPIPTGASTEVVASKSGTKYYLPTCAGVEKISEANKVYFSSPERARTQGYQPADNCTGL